MSEFSDPPIDPTVREGHGPERVRTNYSIGEWIVDTAELAQEGQRAPAHEAHGYLSSIADNLGFLASRLILANPELYADLQRAVDTHPNAEIHDDFLLGEVRQNLIELHELGASAESDGTVTFGNEG